LEEASRQGEKSKERGKKSDEVRSKKDRRLEEKLVVETVKQLIDGTEFRKAPTGTLVESTPRIVWIHPQRFGKMSSEACGDSIQCRQTEDSREENIARKGALQRTM